MVFFCWWWWWRQFDGVMKVWRWVVYGRFLASFVNFHGFFQLLTFLNSRVVLPNTLLSNLDFYQRLFTKICFCNSHFGIQLGKIRFISSLYVSILVAKTKSGITFIYRYDVTCTVPIFLASIELKISFYWCDFGRKRKYDINLICCYWWTWMIILSVTCTVSIWESKQKSGMELYCTDILK